MRNQLLTIFLVSFVCPLMIQTSSAQIALEMEPIEAKSVITNVTLYRNRASITRTTSLDLDAGGYAIFFRDIPEVAYLDSVQARVSNGSLLSVETSSRPIVVDNSKLITELLAEIEGIKIKLVQTEATSESIQLQISMLKTLIEKATNDKISPVDLETFSAQITFIGDRMKNLAIEKTNNTKETEELQKHLRNAMQRKQLISVTRKKQINAVIDIGVVRAGTVEVQLTYIVYNASWSPTYAVRANAQGNEITIDYDALLTQKTGENWTNVALTLSTAQPQQSITPPMPTPWYVDIYQPASPSSAPRTKTMGGDAIYDAAYLGDDSALQMRHSEKNMGVAEASAAASVVNDGPAVSFVLPRTVTVPSNASDAQTTSIATIETSAEHFLIAVPMLTDQVFIRSEVTNKSDYILL
ncbi:MAG: mucoidy inhibitor MuiA family protein, partial [Phycisphaerales bacterium]